VKECLFPKYRYLKLRIKFRTKRSKLLIYAVCDETERDKDLRKIHLLIARKVKYSWETNLFLIVAMRRNQDNWIKMHDKLHITEAIREEYHLDTQNCAETLQCLNYGY